MFIAKILNGQNAGTIVDSDHGDWYRALFGPSVAGGILRPSDLAGYRNNQVYIGQSKHTPVNKDAVRDVMPLLFELLEKDTKLRDKLEWNTKYFKEGMKKAGFDIIDGDSAIVPVMLYDAKLSQIMADELLKKGIYVIGFFFPVVPKDKARIRVQLSAAHSRDHLDKAILAFTEVGRALKII